MNAGSSTSAAHSVQPAAPALSSTATLTQVAGTLAGVLLLILCAAWLLKRLGFAPQSRNRGLLKVAASCQVGQRERVVIVEVNNTWLVLGVTAQQVTPLHTLPAPPCANQTAASPETKADFRQQLLQRLNRTDKPI